MATGQQSLGDFTAFPGVPRVQLWDDYGPVGAGASRAHYVRCENGSEYIAKGRCFNSALPYVAANEYIAAQLAAHLSLPLLDFRIIEFGQELLFGSSYIEPNRHFYPGITKDLFDRVANKNRVYDIVVFDYWIFNPDRNSGNLLVRTTGTRGASDELMFLNDHSHAIITSGKTPIHLKDYRDDAPQVTLDFVRDAVRARSLLETQLV